MLHLKGLKKKLEGMLCRLALSLQEFDFEIKYCKGTANANADALSSCQCGAQ